MSIDVSERAGVEQNASQRLGPMLIQNVLQDFLFRLIGDASPGELARELNGACVRLYRFNTLSESP